MFFGSIPALVTPFSGGKVDEGAFRDLVDWQIAEGTNGLVPVGTTGESPTLSHDEHMRVVEWCVEQAKGRVPVIAGAGSNSTKEAVSLAQHAEQAGADAVLVVAPYYNKPTQEGLYQHFKAINDAIGIPIIMYNIPSRSVVDISVDTMRRLYELKNIAGVKDATANMTRVTQQRAAIGADFNQLSGEDITALGFMAHGGHGCISVTSNVAPRLCAQFQSACLRGDYATALTLQDKLAPLHVNLFVETSPAPIKYAMALLGKCDNVLRLPMVPASEKAQSAVREAMVHAGLINLHRPPAKAFECNTGLLLGLRRDRVIARWRRHQLHQAEHHRQRRGIDRELHHRRMVVVADQCAQHATENAAVREQPRAVPHRLIEGGDHVGLFEEPDCLRGHAGGEKCDHETGHAEQVALRNIQHPEIGRSANGRAEQQSGNAAREHFERRGTFACQHAVEEHHDLETFAQNGDAHDDRKREKRFCPSGDGLTRGTEFGGEFAPVARHPHVVPSEHDHSDRQDGGVHQFLPGAGKRL